MFCENCGEKLSKDAVFCTNCGHKVKDDETVETKEDVKEEATTEEVKVQEDVQEEQVTNEDVKKEEKKEEPSMNNISKENIQKGSTSKAFLIILAILVVLAGIATALYFFLFKKDEKAIDAIEKAFNNMENLNSYTMAIKADVETKGEDSFAMNFNLENSIDIKNKMAKININASYSGVSIEIPAYVDLSDEKNGVIYFKLPEALVDNSTWSKITLGEINFEDLVNESINSSDEEIDLDKIEEKIKNIDFIQKKTSDIDGLDYYELVINEEYIKKIDEALEEVELSDSEIEAMKLEKGFVIGIYIDKKDNYVSKFTLDMADWINEVAAGEIEFEKLNLSIEYKDINKVSTITIPNEAKNAKEIDFDSLGNIGELPNTDYDEDIDNEEYVDDYAITDYGFKVTYKMPEGFEASSVNDETFKIYHSDDLDVTLSNYSDNKTERFEDIEYDKSYYEKESNYKNVELSEEKTLKVNNKEFAYKLLSYETSYGKSYKATVCYQLDDEHVYRVEYEKLDSPITEDELKLFLDIKVTKE